MSRRSKSKKHDTLARRRMKPYSKPWSKLSDIGKMLRTRALAVLRQMRLYNRSLASSCRYIGTDQRTAKAHLGTAIYKKKGRWKARAKDHIQRKMNIYSMNGRIEAITINKSEYAHTISEYLSDTYYVLKSGGNYLDKYRDTVIIDIYGKEHALETEINRVKNIVLQIEDHELWEVYAR